MTSVSGRSIAASIVLIAFAGASFAARAEGEPNIVTCALQRADGEYRGTCDVPCSVNALAIDIDGPNPRTACASPSRKVVASLGPADPDGRQLGTMEGKFPEDPTRFEILPGRDGQDGIARTPFGWFPLRSPQREGESLHLTIAANRQLPPTAEDIRIIERASDLLSDDHTWNRDDARTCQPDPRTWSLFCALRQATVEVTGGLHYRQPALQAVREVVDAVYGTHVSKHRLMEFNNDPSTRLADVRAVLATSQAQLEKRMHR